MSQNRRTVLKLLTATGLTVPFGAGVAWAQSLEQVRVQLGWIPNVQYAGDWIALDRGLMERHGVEVEWYPGGPNALGSPVMLAADRTDIGYSTWFPFLDAIAQGNDFVLLAATFPRNPLGLISLADNPVLEPADLVGKRILAQSENDRMAVNATLALNELPNEWTWVPTGFSPEPLLAGDGDAFTAFRTNQPITLEQMGLVEGEDFHFVSFDDLGFRTYGAIIITTRGYLETNRDAVVGYLRGLISGWDQNEEDPTVAARLAVEKFGRDFGLDLEQQIRQNELQIPLTRYSDGDHLRMSLDRDVIVGPMYDAARATGRTDLPDVDSIADFSVVPEAHEGL